MNRSRERRDLVDAALDVRAKENRPPSATLAKRAVESRRQGGAREAPDHESPARGCQGHRGSPNNAATGASATRAVSKGVGVGQTASTDNYKSIRGWCAVMSGYEYRVELVRALSDSRVSTAWRHRFMVMDKMPKQLVESGSASSVHPLAFHRSEAKARPCVSGRLASPSLGSWWGPRTLPAHLVPFVVQSKLVGFWRSSR